MLHRPVAETVATTPPSKTALTDAVAAAPPRTPQINCATLQPRAPYHCFAGQVLPTQCTNRKNHPKKIGTRLAPLRESGNSSTHHSFARYSPSTEQKSRHPAAAQCRPMHK